MLLKYVAMLATGTNLVRLRRLLTICGLVLYTGVGIAGIWDSEASDSAGQRAGARELRCRPLNKVGGNT